MKLLALGIGKIGSALVADAINSENVSTVVACDIDGNRLNELKSKIISDKLELRRIDVADDEALIKLAKEGCDVVSSTLIGDYNVSLARAAIKAGVGMVDVGVTSSEIYKLNEQAIDAGVTIVPNCGLDPGIDSILEGYGISKLDTVEEIYMWCGGFPQKNTPAYKNPIRYKISWYWRGAIESYLGKAKVLRNGRVEEVDKLTAPEDLHFREPIGECEAFFHSAPFDLIQQLNLRDVRNAWNKTVRWPGHCEIWSKLIALNLTSETPINLKGVDVSPLDFLVELGVRTLQYQKGEGDIVVLRVSLAGRRGGKRVGYNYELIDLYDAREAMTAMGRTTSFPCSIMAQMIAMGNVKDKGVLHAAKVGADPQNAMKFFTELGKRNISIDQPITEPIGR